MSRSYKNEFESRWLSRGVRFLAEARNFPVSVLLLSETVRHEVKGSELLASPSCHGRGLNVILYSLRDENGVVVFRKKQHDSSFGSEYLVYKRSMCYLFKEYSFIVVLAAFKRFLVI